jgi:NAD(P)-dependent dehydrogenase (short-subunit alcohol dehydrogenase family)
MNKRPLISTGKLTEETLAGQVAIVTGAGSGIGFEAAHSLVWLGARVVIAEVDKRAGASAAESIANETGRDRIIFIQTDVGDESSINNLANKAIHAFGKVDIILNNAAVEPIGAVKDVSIDSWDLSYKVNLRGPVLLARAFLPAMLNRNSGVFVCVSSVGGAYMGPYEVLKRAQVELAMTIAAECEETSVVSFTIGPGLVPDTRGAREQMPKLARMMGKTVEEFQEMSNAALISVEAAGAGFAAAVALASQFRGQEISSSEALHSAGIELEENTQPVSEKILTAENITQIREENRLLRAGLEEQRRQWKTLGLFQRQWMTRDFNKRVGMPIEKVFEKLTGFEQQIESGKLDTSLLREIPFSRLAEFFDHLQEMTKDYVKDVKVREEQVLLQEKWKGAAKNIDILMK